jgi:hypothetical protein
LPHGQRLAYSGNQSAKPRQPFNDAPRREWGGGATGGSIKHTPQRRDLGISNEYEAGSVVPLGDGDRAYSSLGEGGGHQGFKLHNRDHILIL